MIEQPEQNPPEPDLDPDPDLQDPESGAGTSQDESEADDFENDPARNPDDPNLENLKGA
jgi:hypothetical protein